MTLKIGQKAPRFQTINQNGEKRNLEFYKGKKLILFFYPKNNTPTCTKQVCNLRDNHIQLVKAGFSVAGVSIDSQKSHLKFANKFNLPYDLLVDENHEMVNTYQVWGEKLMFGKLKLGTIRTTFIINENGVIQQIISPVKSAEHTRQILDVVNA
ncbi:MAG: thioredoxin-dependent thiol peroxidase [Bacteroidetes bacterium]|nr:thioredoxin-dependent thiol peroxidase [Bacteroidota bacterium]